jgi:hypothetical protein
MPYLTNPIAASAPFVRSVAIAALLGATFLATPPIATSALAQAAGVTTPAAANATETKGETVEQRITELVATNRTTPPQNMSAVQDLHTYQQFAQAHVDGLKNLTAAFSKLYDTMSDDQKKNADQVFLTSGRGTAAPKG